MTIPAAPSASQYATPAGDPKQARAQFYEHQQAYLRTLAFQGGEMGSLTATDAGTLAVDSVDAGTIYVAAQAGSPSPVVNDLGTPTRGAPWKTLVFEAGITIVHGPGTLELPGGADILTQDGDSAVVVYDTVGSPGFWRVIDYRRRAVPVDGILHRVERINITVNTASWTAQDAMDARYLYFLKFRIRPETDAAVLRLRTDTDAGASDYEWLTEGTRVGSSGINVASDGADTQIDLTHNAGGVGSGVTEGGDFGIWITPADGTRYDEFSWQGRHHNTSVNETSIVTGTGSRLSATPGKKPTILFSADNIAFMDGVFLRVRK